MPKVSVIIPAYNCVKYLPAAIDSALAQTYQDFEAIIIDDGSTDNTRTVLREYLEKYPGKLHYIYQSNQGQAVARNVGIREAKGEYIALLDADDLWLPDRLEEGVRMLDKNHNIALVHSNITAITDDGRTVKTPGRDKRFLSGFIFEHLLTQSAHVSCLTVLFRKSCCSRVGMFDENMSLMSSEDRDLWIRITKEFGAGYIDKVLAYYRLRPDSASNDQKKLVKGLLYVIDKHCPAGSGNRILRNRALSRVYRDLGDEFLYRQEFVESIRHYLKALKFKPFSLWPWVNMAKASLRFNAK